MKISSTILRNMQVNGGGTATIFAGRQHSWQQFGERIARLAAGLTNLGLQGGDLRAAERTYQVLHQVAGRAGRAQRPGRALLQTYMPEHPVMQALISGDRDNFMAQERQARQFQGLPPFGRLVALIVSGRNEAQVIDTARGLGRAAPRQTEVEVLGPAPAPLSLLRGRFRQRLLLKCQRGLNASALARAWVDQVDIPNQVRVAIDVDPYSFM